MQRHRPSGCILAGQVHDDTNEGDKMFLLHRRSQSLCFLLCFSVCWLVNTHKHMLHYYYIKYAYTYWNIHTISECDAFLLSYRNTGTESHNPTLTRMCRSTTTTVPLKPWRPHRYLAFWIYLFNLTELLPVVLWISAMRQKRFHFSDFSLTAS